MKKIFLLVATLFFILCNSILFSQTEKPNSIYLELGGNCVFYSINYDRLFSNHIGARVGANFFLLPIDKTTAFGYFVVMQIIYLIGNGNSRLELGGGVNYLNEKDGDSIWGPSFIIGYRYQPTNGGFVFRIGFTPTYVTDHIMPMGGVSFGYNF